MSRQSQRQRVFWACKSNNGFSRRVLLHRCARIVFEEHEEQVLKCCCSCETHFHRKCINISEKRKKEKRKKKRKKGKKKEKGKKEKRKKEKVTWT